jgi:hypothetical protein
MRLLDHLIWLDASPEASETLMNRKYGRSHFGKESYQDKGVAKQDFVVWWDHYVFSRYEDHKPKAVPDNTIIIDCLTETAGAVAEAVRCLHY